MAFVTPTFLPNRQASEGTLHRVWSRAVIPKWIRPVTRRSLIMSTAAVTEKGSGMRLIPQADDSTVEKLGCRSWGTWGCEPSTFPWSYDDDEVCLVIEGDFTVIPDDGGEPMVVKAGDIAYFPKNLSCTWEVRKTVNKYYKFGIKI